jgi:hypothetical protein
VAIRWKDEESMFMGTQLLYGHYSTLYSLCGKKDFQELSKKEERFPGTVNIES